MKHPRKPTKNQCILMQKWKLDHTMWFVVKDTPEIMEIVHRYHDGTRKVIHKE